MPEMVCIGRSTAGVGVDLWVDGRKAQSEIAEILQDKPCVKYLRYDMAVASMARASMVTKDECTGLASQAIWLRGPGELWIAGVQVSERGQINSASILKAKAAFEALFTRTRR